MAITYDEIYKSRSGTKISEERQYKVIGAADNTEALTGLITYLASTLSVIDGKVISINDCKIEEEEAGYHIGTGSWKNPDAQPNKQSPGSFNMGFDFSTQSINLKHSISTRHTYQTGDAHKRDFKGAINVDGDNNINGVDIIVPIFNFTMGCPKSTSDITSGYLATLRDAIGLCNASAWNGFGIQELLMTRVSGQRRDTQTWDLTFNWAYIKNLATSDNYKIDDLGPIEKYGWEYVWAFYELSEESSGSGSSAVKYLRPKATNAYVEQVYKTVDYSTLSIPAFGS